MNYSYERLRLTVGKSYSMNNIGNTDGRRGKWIVGRVSARRLSPLNFAARILEYEKGEKLRV